MTVKVPTKVFNALNAYMRTPTQKDLMNYRLTIFMLESYKEQEAANWVKTHIEKYLEGVCGGFEIDNSQENQLKEIHGI